MPPRPQSDTRGPDKVIGRSGYEQAVLWLDAQFIQSQNNGD